MITTQLLLDKEQTNGSQRVEDHQEKMSCGVTQGYSFLNVRISYKRDLMGPAW